MTRRALQSTQIAVTLAVNVVTVANNRPQVVALPLLTLTPILFCLWTVTLWLNRQWFDLATLAADIQEAGRFVVTVYLIGLKSLAWGLGGLSL